MNKYQEALKFFKKVANRIPLKFANDKFCEQYDESLILIKELVDKVTPKKPINKATYNYDDVPFTALCPNCKENLGYESKGVYNYCPKCGQRILWE